MSISNAPSVPLDNYLEKEGFKLQRRVRCPYQFEVDHSLGFSIYFCCNNDLASIEIYDQPLSYPNRLRWLDLGDESLLLEAEWDLEKDVFEGAYLEHWEAFYLFWMLWSDVKDIVLE